MQHERRQDKTRHSSLLLHRSHLFHLKVAAQAFEQHGVCPLAPLLVCQEEECFWAAESSQSADQERHQFLEPHDICAYDNIPLRVRERERDRERVGEKGREQRSAESI